jgi:fumarylacetoacetase
MEIGFLVGDTNPIGVPVTIADAESRLFGAVLVNDWSARDIQAWESQPLGPFLSKNFATTISPWVVLMDALDPYRTSPRQRGVNDPPLLEYLTSGDNERRGAIDLTIQAALTSVHMRARGFPEVTLGRAAFRHHYWTPAQMVAHHGSNGCRLRPGDLIGSGTVSGEGPDARGCLLELTERGRRQLALPTGEQRTYLSDGDEVVLRASAERHDRPRIGFGECRGQILPATPNTSTRALSPSRP